MTLLPACATGVSNLPGPSALRLPDGVAVIDATDGAPMQVDDLLRRMASADFVLLGELHDNPVHHEVRGRLIAAFSDRQPAIVFEQFAETQAPIPHPTTTESREAWLDRNGFDRQSWNWPLHSPVVNAAIASGADIWGSGVSRDRLRSVISEGESAAPSHLRAIMQSSPLDGAGRAILDRELVDSHCGQLPANMVAGMRVAQIVRDASMANALGAAAATGPAWLIAGNGHVRRDIAVPRLLRALQPRRSAVAIGFVERPANGGAVSPETRSMYDIVVVTPGVERPDPCAGFPAGQ
jgi:uncharacterized iron-regulated protein